MKLLILALLAIVAFTNAAIVRNEVWRDASLHNGKVDIIMYMNAQTDFTKLSNKKGVNVHQIRNHDDRGYLVMNTLVHQAESTQKSTIAFLKKNNLKFKSFWITNAIAVFQVPEGIVKQLELSKDIKTINTNEEFLVEIEKPHPFSISNKSKKQVEWNVRWINAHKVWAEGHKGKGIVTGAIDTGVEHNHPALVKAYRGTTGNNEYNHNFNWYDADRKVRTPVDSNGHGTHCTGTVCGGVDRQIGVAPEAKFIHCRAISGSSTPAKYLSCYQFFAAPHDLDGKNANPSIRPHTTSHSYGCGGCRPDDLKEAFAGLKASGIFLSVSAGNSGSRCASISRPPGFYDSAFTVGALNKESRNIATFSSRGPITYDRSNRMKPEISAPGVNVVSSSVRGSYRALSGTSMASPAVSGAVALLWQAVPELSRDIEKTIDIIQSTARKQESSTCGPPTGSPNNVYGYGGIDVYEAYKAAKKLFK